MNDKTGEPELHPLVVNLADRVMDMYLEGFHAGVSLFYNTATELADRTGTHSLKSLLEAARAAVLKTMFEEGKEIISQEVLSRLNARSKNDLFDFLDPHPDKKVIDVYLSIVGEENKEGVNV
ncbi:hypothetical protein [Thermosulfurimonas sp. F29]|uniref:hypothetical protein n=1 Tax=Thermosulfurimonas sp. F29 TaxID=2867247 RepID=UPI001C83C204|nr:hypothetical protein [Thermosulfurimonas sp. F29]MBX6424139.1 hypothetical protein [Thermosulfurimonas sp. F29]